VKLPSPFRSWGEHFAIDLNGARAVFTTRRGGVSTGPYESLNLGRLTADRPEAVYRNRERLESRVGVPLAMIRQVHGTSVRRLAGSPPRPPDLPQADGQVTSERGLAPMVLVADCLPIVLAGRGGVAVLHAGWRGLAGGIVAEGAGALRKLGVQSELLAAIGPGAGPCCYEVGEEVHQAFADYGEAVRRGRNLDLKAIAREQLVRAGAREVHDIGLCTICGDPSLLFSHRRDQGVTGRQAGLAWLS
jgi:YfiH family protein